MGQTCGSGQNLGGRFPIQQGIFPFAYPDGGGDRRDDTPSRLMHWILNIAFSRKGCGGEGDSRPDRCSS